MGHDPVMNCARTVRVTGHNRREVTLVTRPGDPLVVDKGTTVTTSSRACRSTMGAMAPKAAETFEDEPLAWRHRLDEEPDPLPALHEILE